VEKAAIARSLMVVRNGRDAMRYLLGLSPYSDRAENPLPTLIVLDLKMPIADGFDVLRWLPTRPELKALPAVVLTSSNQPVDRAQALELGARDYFVKPANPARLLALVQDMHARWLSDRSAATALADGQPSH
jgi:CheY-like chemotaxis protein